MNRKLAKIRNLTLANDNRAFCPPLSVTPTEVSDKEFRFGTSMILTLFTNLEILAVSLNVEKVNNWAY